MGIEVLLREMVARGASDLHLRVGAQPAFRINGELYRLQSDKIALEAMRASCLS